MHFPFFRLHFLLLWFLLNSLVAAESSSYLTVGEFVGFLNKSNTSDVYHCYDEKMGVGVTSSLFRKGTPGNYSYFAKQEDLDKPLYYIDLNAAQYYAQWKGKSLEELAIIPEVDEELKVSNTILLLRDEMMAQESAGEQPSPGMEWGAGGLIVTALLLGSGGFYYATKPCYSREMSRTFEEAGTLKTVRSLDFDISSGETSKDSSREDSPVDLIVSAAAERGNPITITTNDSPPTDERQVTFKPILRTKPRSPRSDIESSIPHIEIIEMINERKKCFDHSDSSPDSRWQNFLKKFVFNLSVNQRVRGLASKHQSYWKLAQLIQEMNQEGVKKCSDYLVIPGWYSLRDGTSIANALQSSSEALTKEEQARIKDAVIAAEKSLEKKDDYKNMLAAWKYYPYMTPAVAERIASRIIPSYAELTLTPPSVQKASIPKIDPLHVIAHSFGFIPDPKDQIREEQIAEIVNLLNFLKENNPSQNNERLNALCAEINNRRVTPRTISVLKALNGRAADLLFSLREDNSWIPSLLAAPKRVTREQVAEAIEKRLKQLQEDKQTTPPPWWL